jgi:nucleotide-binding universal stress UspA family protein
MSNPTAKNPASMAQERTQTTRESGQPVKVTLVVEHSPHRWDSAVLMDLANLLSPAQVELTLIHAMANLLDGLPKRYEESELLGQHLAEGTKRQDESRADLLRDLQMAGFQVQHEESYTLASDNLEPILNYLKATGQELMILCGSHSPGSQMGRNHFFMNLTSHSPISTILLKRQFSFKGRALNALFGVDASDATLNAARKLAHLLPPQKINLTLATVQSPVYQENAVLAPYVNQQILTEALEANAGMTFEMVSDILKPEGFNIQDLKILIGSPATELGYVAEQENPDLLIVGSHNHKGFLAWVMGSVSSQLMHWDTHNILVIR